MKNGYKILITLTNVLNNTFETTNQILEAGKETFSKNEEYIHFTLGLLKEISNTTNNMKDEIFVMNKKLYDTVYPIVQYSNNLFNNYLLVNSYKLYDCLAIDLINLRNLLNEFLKNVDS